ncbi:RteC domain-containing protein [Zobellia laminariae]|uniref:RteC domain-containing protein n=1 Tax=Zobellia laminariae TaxID=248906 RepID=UPI0026F40E87|nr:RteC domain-containing protein [Zobellia laminariae]WKX76955.1 RteC domain-containing protein [Zobellia laminariae]
MDFNVFTESLQRDLYKARKDIPHGLKRANHAIKLCRDLLTMFKKQVMLNGFDTIEAEIDFFKHIKTVPLTQFIYFSQVRSFELEFPKGNINAQRKFIKKRLKDLNTFFVNHLEFNEYIEAGFTHFDELYFTRKYFDKFPDVNGVFYFRDPEFSTAKDMLLAEFKAFHLCVDYLQNRLIDKSKSPQSKSNELNNHISLQWTSSKSALTELIYALHYNRVINHGNTDIKEIAVAMQQLFHFDLGDFYKTFADIKERKISRTKFLDEMAAGLQSHMENTEE